MNAESNRPRAWRERGCRHHVVPLFLLLNVALLARAADTGAHVNASTNYSVQGEVKSVIHTILQYFTGHPLLGALTAAVPVLVLLTVYWRWQARRSKGGEQGSRSHSRSDKILGKRYRALFENA